MEDKKLLGSWGEKFATAVLYQQGYEILDTNFRCRMGEVDIVCRKDDSIVFVEVKTREGDGLIRPCLAVNREKQRRIRLVATRYMQMKKLYHYNVRFQVIEILFNQIQDAF